MSRQRADLPVDFAKTLDQLADQHAKLAQATDTFAAAVEHYLALETSQATHLQAALQRLTRALV